MAAACLLLGLLGLLWVPRGLAAQPMVFLDGFETGDASRWSGVHPQPPPPGGALFVAALTPQDGVLSLGSGQATLLLSADGAYGVLRFSYSNLTGPITSAHIHAPDGQILFDIDEAEVQPDGSRIWTFVDAGSWTRERILAALAAGQCYVNLHTARYPAGEIKGFLRRATGGSTFTPPPPPPQLPPGNPDAGGAARFLRQATFGSTLAEVADVQARGFRAWIAEQLTLPTASHLDYVDALPDDPGNPDDDLFSYNARESLWKQMILGPDQLRQRVAFALSELLVVSDRTDELYDVSAIAAYMDLLTRDAFGNYRTVLEDVTLSPAMGAYLDMASNDREDPATGRNPNENYAREVLQLFSIGLYKLHPDGTLKLGPDGLPIPTYDQDEIRGFAKVFTGWTYAGQDHEQDWMFYYPNGDWRRAMEPWPEHHSSGPKLLLDGLTLPAGGTPQADLRAALDTIFRHPNVGPLVCRHLIQRLVTSNPSPAYVYRCGQVFDNDGAGVRGNLAAVVRAILLDWEARSTDVLQQPGYGQAREPMLRFVELLRALHAQPPADGRFRWYYISDPFYGISQMPLFSPTVFNFFEPTWAQPGPIAAAGLVSPELKLVDGTSVFGTPNFLRNVILYGAVDQGDPITLDWSELVAAATVGDAALIDRIDLLFYAGRMSAATRAAFAAALADPDFPTSEPDRVQTVVWLVMLTPEFVAGG
jgi:uncharacterized protein (DUF1800 family)